MAAGWRATAIGIALVLGGCTASDETSTGDAAPGGTPGGVASNAAASGSEAASAATVVRLSGPTMGTAYRVSVVTPTAHTGSLQAAIDDRLAEINRRMSTYDPGSELSRFNAADATDWFGVSAETAIVVRQCLGMAEATEGAFDPTVGPAVDLWGFGPEASRFEPPTDAAIADALGRVGHARVEASVEPPALRKADPRVRLDLSAAAKGYAVDAIAALVEEAGFDAYLVEIGGEVRARGRKPDGGPWRLGVEAPRVGRRAVQQVVALTAGAIATSGDYRNYFEHEGVRYSHTLDPTTGRPVTHDLAAVSVRTATCLEADGLATALLVMGPERGYDWAVEHRVAALFVSRTPEGEATERATPTWEALADPGAEP